MGTCAVDPSWNHLCLCYSKVSSYWFDNKAGLSTFPDPEGLPKAPGCNVLQLVYDNMIKCNYIWGYASLKPTIITHDKGIKVALLQFHS